MIMQADVILVAAGKGERMGAVLPKPFLSLSGTPLLVHTLRAVTRSALVRKVILVIAAEHKSLCQKILQSYGPLSVPITLVHGGAERQDSVRCGLVALDPDSEIVAIHDAARPFLDPDILDASIHAAVEHGGAVVAVPARDTIKRVTEGGVVVETVPRQQLWLAQTPQTFRVSVIREAHARAAYLPDDAPQCATFAIIMAIPFMICQKSIAPQGSASSSREPHATSMHRDLSHIR